MGTPEVQELTIEQLTARARQLAMNQRRFILGIAGSPGVGKSTVAQELVHRLGPRLAVLVPMDGFHLANEVLYALGRRERKGAPDTFDVHGYAALLTSIRAQQSVAATGADATLYAPLFRRDIDEPIGSALAIAADVPLVITEGNYLLLDQPVWSTARQQLDEVWFLVEEDQVRRHRLAERHRQFGSSVDEADARANGTDQRNAELIEATAPQADVVVRMVAAALG